MSRFEIWDETDFSQRLTMLISGSMFLVVLFISLFQNSLDNNMFFYAGSVTLLIFFVALLGKKIKFAAFSTKRNAYVGSVAGLAIALVLGFLSRGGNNLTVLKTQAVLSLGDLTFFFTNVLAPLIEPLLFRVFIFVIVLAVVGAIIKYITKKENKFITGFSSVLITNYIFGFYHVAVYFQQTGNFLGTQDSILVATLFGIFYSLGYLATKSISFEMAWHFTNNLFAMPYSTAEIMGTIAVAAVAFVAMVEFADRLKVKL